MKRTVLTFVSMLIALSTLLHAEIPTKDSVTKLYVATFNRAPDAAGLDYWLNDSGLQLEEIAQSFFDQSETQEKYPAGSTNTEFVTAVYDNLFNREPDHDGLTYWVAELNSERIEKPVFILAVINGAQNTELGNDATILENKTIVGRAFADAGLDDVELAVNIMSGITDDYATVTAALETLHPEVIIKLLALFSQGSEDIYGSEEDTLTRIQHLVAVSNEVNKQSKISLKYELVHTQKYTIDDSDISDTILHEITYDSGVSSLRDTYDADEVIVFQAYSVDDYCGIAWLNDGDKTYAVATVSIDCSDTTMAHELGHTKGLAHARIQDDLTPIKSYGYGWGIDSEFITIMSYWNYFDSIRLPVFEMVYSNPTLDCQGYACGVEIGLPDEADASQAIRESMKSVSEFY